MEKKHGLGKDVVIYGIPDFVFKLVGFLTFPIYTRVFSVSEYGLIALILVSIGLMGMFVNVGVNNAVQRHYWEPGIQRNEQQEIVSSGLFLLFCSSVLWGVILTIVLSYSSHWIEQSYGIRWEVIILALATLFVDQLLSYSVDTIRLHFKPKYFLVVSFVKNLVGMALGLLLVVGFQLGMYGYFAGPLIASSIAVFLALWFIRKDLVFKVELLQVKKLLLFGFPFIFVGLAYWIFGSMDRWMLLRLSTVQEVGLYSVAYKFATVIVFLNTAFGRAWSPYANKTRSTSVDYQRIFGKIFAAWFFSLASVGFLVSLFSNELLQLITPKEYWPAASVLPFVVAGVVLFGTTQISVIGISIEKKTKYLTYGAWVAAIANLILNWIFIPQYGALGAAISTLLSYLLLTLYFLYWTQRLHPIVLEKTSMLWSSGLIGFSLLFQLIFKNTDSDLGVLSIKLLIVFAVAFVLFRLRVVDLSYIKGMPVR